MKRHLATFALMSCLTVNLIAVTPAAAIVSQAPDTTTDFALLLNSDFGAAAQPQQGDIFSLVDGVSGKLNATWFGGYISDNGFMSRPALVDVFSVDFFSVTAGVPDTSPLASFTGLDLDITRTSTGIFLPPDPGPGAPPEERFELFRYSAILDFAAIAATLPELNDYLFSVTNDSNGTADTNWYWASSLQGSELAQFRGGPPGNTNGWTSYSSQSIDVNLAYSLSVPTPATTSMLLLSLGLLASIRSRRQRHR